jgi:hypothetical protein
MDKVDCFFVSVEMTNYFKSKKLSFACLTYKWKRYLLEVSTLSTMKNPDVFHHDKQSFFLWPFEGRCATRDSIIFPCLLFFLFCFGFIISVFIDLKKIDYLLK